jgi:Peptidase A4 family
LGRLNLASSILESSTYFKTLLRNSSVHVLHLSPGSCDHSDISLGMKFSLLLLASIASKAILVSSSPLSKKDIGPIYPLKPPVGIFSLDGRSATWAGAWMQAPPTQTYNSIYSQFQVQKPSMPAGADHNTTYYAGVWIGLSNDAGFDSSQEGIIVQAGVEIQGKNGNFSVGAWWEWFPSGDQDLALPIAWGDVVTINITIAGSGTANIVVSNKSQNKNVSVPSQKGNTAALTKALYVVEDPWRATGPTPFINFGKVVFNNCRAMMGTKQVGFDNFSGAITMVDPFGKSTAAASISGNSTVNVSYAE